MVDTLEHDVGLEPWRRIDKEAVSVGGDVVFPDSHRRRRHPGLRIKGNNINEEDNGNVDCKEDQVQQVESSGRKGLYGGHDN